jgi:IS5 family transposase
VECIAKGKEHKKYEFGCKVSVVTTSKRGWVVGIEALHGNPYDGHTLKAAHAQVAKLTGVTPEEILVDRGYRGAQHHPEDTKVYLSGRKLSGRLKRLLRRRAAIEPVIGHLKQDHRMKRNYLQGKNGDCSTGQKKKFARVYRYTGNRNLSYIHSASNQGKSQNVIRCAADAIQN